MKTIDNYTTITTKKGDNGTSRNFSNDLLPKTDVLFDTLGAIDELTSMLGLVYHYTSLQEWITIIQLDLQHISSIIATRQDDDLYQRLIPITMTDLSRIEAWEQQLLDTAKIERRFVLPGSESTKEGAYLDVARSISRRAEREVLRFAQATKRDDLQSVLAYVNRLSDVLFIMARSCDPK